MRGSTHRATAAEGHSRPGKLTIHTNPTRHPFVPDETCSVSAGLGGRGSGEGPTGSDEGPEESAKAERRARDTDMQGSETEL
jgi:hypothetical protein